MKLKQRCILGRATGSVGFTLIEMAIVVLIVGIVFSIGASSIGFLLKRAKARETQAKLDSNVDSVVSYTAGPDVSTTGVTDGKAADNGVIADIKNKMPYGKDSFGIDFHLILDSNLFPPSGKIKDTICGSSSTYIVVCRDKACSSSNQIQNVAFVMASGGENQNIQTDNATTRVGAACPAGKTCVSIPDYNEPGNTMDDYVGLDDTYNSGAAVTTLNYDDITKWVTLDELRTKIGCEGSQLKILNNELPSAKIGSYYYAAVNASGGIKPSAGYYWCAESNCGSTMAGISDITYDNASTALAIQAEGTCSSCSTSTCWKQGNQFTLYGDGGAGIIPSAVPYASPACSGTNISGTYKINVYVKDYNPATSGATGNSANKSYALTVNPN
ncbi:MAG: prepilin-type N-terminal cleavage/methylation domain-containing protein [Candidatus Magnetominusculus sp. LBB02]|nr:prepilin-type N-terminal cleavage/methylation domain-containing protein [Candidatus Magnetominusculus sp. LBB02]MCG6553152.1 prepilin-type N-terminal cleavage/methylation domain-containing protein [Candidatus Magnetominusculus sp. LBB02]